MTSAPDKIPGGFAKSWRKEMQSEVWLMPPLYHRVWYWLRLNVQHEPFLFPTRGTIGIWVLPGQRITSLQQIAEGVKWTEWGREVVPNKKSIKDILDWLGSREMVTVESNAKGTLITVTNWHSYNGYGMGKVAGQSNAEVTHPGHKEEGKEGKEKMKEPKTLSASLDAVQGQEPDVDFYLTAKKRKLSGERLETFNAFMDAFKDKRGRAQAADAWLNMQQPTKELMSDILKGAAAYAAKRPGIISSRGTPKMAQGWLTGRRWEDEAGPELSQSGDSGPPEKDLLDFFEDLWKAYPMDGRVGKEEALRHYNASVKTEQDMDQIDYALGVYLEHLKEETWKRPQNAAAWFGNWRSWIPEGIPEGPI